MMNEILIRLVTVLVGKWKREHLATVLLKAEVELCHDTLQLSSADKICACTLSPAGPKVKNK